MPYYCRLGLIPPKRHTQFRQPEGSLYHEELIGMQGFSGVQSLLYHLRPPTAIQAIQAGNSLTLDFEATGPLRHRHLQTADIPEGGDAIAARYPLLANTDLCISVARPNVTMDYWYRFAHGDEVIFIHEGHGQLETQFGVLTYRPGDYLAIPTGVLWRILPTIGISQRMLVIEAWGHLEAPQRYLNRSGQFLEHAPYCERDIRPPEALTPQDETGEFEVRVKSRGYVTRYQYDHHPVPIPVAIKLPLAKPTRKNVP
jgi:homogentisate 1,2-dioxygenase